jgi:preprotein translocase subunit SecD
VAPSPGTLRVGRYFAVLLGVIIVLYGIVFWPSQRHVPKLGLDLEGGTQVVLQANLAGGKQPTKSDMQQAQTILTNRVNAQGVNDAQVVIQGTNQIVISVPGKESKNLKDVSQAALLQFRPELQAAVAATSTTATPSTSASVTPTATGSASVSPTTSAKASTTPTPKTTTATATAKPAATTAPAAHRSTSGAHAVFLAASSSASPTATASATASAKATPSATGTAASPTTTASSTGTAATSSAPAASNTPIDQWANLGFSPPTTPAALAALNATQAAAVQAVVTNWNCNDVPKDVASLPLVTCDTTDSSKYLLGPVIVPGSQVSSASAQAPDATTGSLGWAVNLTLKSSGEAAWATYTSEHNFGKDSSDPGATVAFTLDSQVIEASQIQSTINGSTQITGTFTQTTATDLADSLKFGALPISFTEPDFTNISASLGSQQLKDGLLAGGIGLALVVVYSLLYYRALGLVTIASLLVSGALTYAMLVILGVHINLTLTLAGIAGFIVAVGITADSFVVFFERIKDEVHEGRSAKVAVPRAWIRARRTIISADSVSLLAAVILYEFAAGDVRGFAFTLGLSTVLDLVVVFLFTHPLVSLVSRSESFGSARLSGLNSLRAVRPDLAYADSSPAYGSAASNDQFVPPSEDPAVPNLVKPTPGSSNGAKPGAHSNGAGANGAGSSGNKPSKPVKAAPGATAAERAAARRGISPSDRTASADQHEPDATDEGDQS